MPSAVDFPLWLYLTTRHGTIGIYLQANQVIHDHAAHSHLAEGCDQLPAGETRMPWSA